MRTPYSEDQIEHLCLMYNRMGEEHMAYLIMEILEKKLGKVHTVTIDVRKMIHEEYRVLQKKEQISADKCDIWTILSKRLEEQELENSKT